MIKSPSGSACPYYYMGGELHPLKYGSYYAEKEKLFAVMKAEEEFILKSSGTNNRRIWIDLYDTVLDNEVADALAKHIKAISPKIRKLCLVGVPRFTRHRIKRALKREVPEISVQTRFFDDPEEAKKWLVGEGF